MPIVLHHQIEPAGEVGLWRIEESEEWFLTQLDLELEEQVQLAGIRGHRRLEWLAVRLLIHRMSGRRHRGIFVKDQFGKPHLLHSDYQISVSHSRLLAAAVAGPVPVGVDIQKIVPKIERIAHRFLRPEERESLRADSRIEHLHAYWGAKEALYKAYGRRELDFRRHILIEPFTFRPDGGTISGQVDKPPFFAAYSVAYEWFDNYMLVMAAEKRL